MVVQFLPSSRTSERSFSSPAGPSPPRPEARGKFLFLGGQKFYLRGVTYGPLRAGHLGSEYGEPPVVEADLALMAARGANAVRVYTAPPRWFLDAALENGLRVMVGLPWEEHVAFLEDRRIARRIEQRVRAAVSDCAGHPAVLCYAVGNEIPAPIVRWHGRRSVERFLQRLSIGVREEDPTGLVTYANYPSTEYLDLPWVDLVCFNVFLEEPSALEAYLHRIHNLSGDRPVVLTELGLDSCRNGVGAQVTIVSQEVRSAFLSGCSGVFVFSWTDQWHRGGQDVTDWGFGLTDRTRSPKPALDAVARVFGAVPFPAGLRWPRVSVVVCSLNGAHRIRECLDGLQGLDYPDYEVIVVNDGSTDRTAAIAREYGYGLISTENRGLGSARNTGLQAASGDIVAFIDDDAYPDRDWLRYLAYEFLTTDHVGIGGPNISPPGDGRLADAVANTPGGPIHVLLSDREAEHIPGCNMAFRKAALEEVGGFDSRFRVAGDDVDLCWRLRARGWTLGFTPSAVVWHHRRSSVRAFWRQQRGYGVAEALLERKWPEKYNSAGHLSWAGRVYGGAGTSRHRWRIYQGVWGTAPFQFRRTTQPGPLWSLSGMPEWYLLVAALAVLALLGLMWPPLLAVAPAAAAGLAASLVRAGKSARRSVSASRPRSNLDRASLWSTILFLHLIQPLARLAGRLGFGLTPWRRRALGAPTLPRPRTHAVWTEQWRSPTDTLRTVERALQAAGAVVIRGDEHESWDVEVRGGAIGGVRLLMTVEEHGRSRQLTRFRWWPRFHGGWALVSGILLLLSVGAGLAHEWIPYGLLLAPAVLLAAVGLWQCGAASEAVAANVRSDE